MNLVLVHQSLSLPAEKEAMVGSPTFDIPRLSIGLTPYTPSPFHSHRSLFHPVPCLQTSYLQTEMQVGQIWGYKMWPVKGLEQQLPDFCRDCVFQGEMGSSGALPQGVALSHKVYPGAEPLG